MAGCTHSLLFNGIGGFDMKKRVISLLLVIATLSVLLPNFVNNVQATNGITEAEVLERLSKAETKWKNGAVYVDGLNDGCGTCFGFGRELFHYIFNAELPTLWSVSTAKFANNMTNIEEIWHLNSGYALEEIKSLLLKAKPGDVLVATNGTWNHCVIIRSVVNDGSGVYVYDANWKKDKANRPLIRTNSLWSAQGIRGSKPIGVTLYRYKNYTDVTASTSTCTITFDPNGGSVSPSSKTIIVGSKLPNLPIPTRNGFTFEGWAVERIENGTTFNGSTVMIPNGSAFTEDITLYAFWVCSGHTYEADVCANCGAKLRYDNGFDTSAVGIYQVTASTAYMRTGPYQVKDLVKTLRKGETVQVTGSVVNSYGNTWLKTSEGYYIHADKMSQYNEPQYTITLDDGSTCSRITVTNGKAYGTLPTPSKEGYKFNGWYTTKTGGKQITASTVVNLTGDQILYAHWDKDNHICTKDNPFVDSVHPHFTYYTCSICGTVFTDRSTNYVDPCEICNPVAQPPEDPCSHPKSNLKYSESNHPHYNYYICSICGAEFMDGSSTPDKNCENCWMPWSEWTSTQVYPSKARQVETRQMKVSDGYIEYRYGRYIDSTGKNNCWCAKYLEGLSYVSGKATLQYSNWDTTRYYADGIGWTCGFCNGNHIGVDKVGADGRSWWAEYKLPGGDFYWEESRQTDAVYETQYRYRDLVGG